MTLAGVRLIGDRRFPDGHIGQALDAALTALLAGEPQRASGLIGDSTVDAATAVRWLSWNLSARWWPGPVGAVIGDAPPSPPSPGPSDRPLLNWLGEVLPMSLSLRSLATGARRAGVGQGATMFGGLVPTLAGWHRSAHEAGDPLAAAQVALLIHDVARRAGVTDIAREALDEAAAVSALAGARHLAEGDVLLTPLQSPETFGFDLEARGEPAELGDPGARSVAGDHYRTAREAFAGAAEAAGVVAADLRLAWLDRLASRPQASHARLRGALVAAEEADRATRMLLLTHRAVDDLMAGRLAATRPGPVAELAARGNGPGSRSFVIGCAGIVHATACALRDGGMVESALAAFDLAGRLTRAMRDRAGELPLASDLGVLYGRLRSSGATIATIEEVVTAAIAPHGGFGGASAIDSVDWLRVADALMTLHKQNMEEQDPDALDDLGRRFRVLLARAPGGPRTLLRPDTDFLVVQEAANQRLAELSIGRAGPLGGGGEWAEMEAAHVDLAVVSISSSVTTIEVMAPRSRAEVAALRGDRDEADRHFTAALAAAGPLNPAMALSVLAAWGSRRDELLAGTRAFLSGRPAINPEFGAMLWVNARQWEEAYNALVAAGREAPEPAGSVWRENWDGVTLRARIAIGRGRYAEARVLATEAVARFERWFSAVTSDAFRVAVLDDVTVRRLYQVAATAALAEGDDAAAFAAADRTRSFSLGALVSESAWATDRPLACRHALRAWRQARAEWTGAFDRRRSAWRRLDPRLHARTARELAQAQSRLDEVAGEVERDAPGHTSQPSVLAPPVTAAEVSACLDPGTLVVEYVIGDDELLTWAVTATSCQGWRSEIDSLEFLGTVARLHAAWSGAGRPDATDAATVSGALLAPVGDLLDEHSRVVFVPHRTMHVLPFHALPHRGRVLGADHVVSQLPAASLIPHLAGRSTPRLDRGVLVVGDPATDPARRLHRLPGARIEAITVARTLDTTALVAEAADEATVQDGLRTAGGVAHLATHGLLDDEAPNLSALVLAGDDQLTVAELLGLGLDTDLAVLSACDSGRGDITHSGDVVGLARGLLAAGVRHAVVSLWPVDDRAGCLTMAAMAELLAGGASVAAALGAAQQRVRRAGTTDRDAWYADLAALADVPAVAGGRRTRRDAVPPRAPRDLPADHPTWWAPFIHIGI